MLTPVLLGVLLGIANVLACAALYAVGSGDLRAAPLVFVYGIVPGLIAGAVLGLVAGAMRGYARIYRFIAIALPSALMVYGLGSAFWLLVFVPYALVPTLALAFVLEARTRRPLTTPGTLGTEGDPVPPPPRSAVPLAMVLGAVVVFIVLVGSIGIRPRALGETFFPFGLGCGLGLGAPFGVIADVTRGRSPWLRRALLGLLAVATTLVLDQLAGSVVGIDDLVLLSLVPSGAGCLLLERCSRPPAPVPTAVARGRGIRPSSS